MSKGMAGNGMFGDLQNCEVWLTYTQTSVGIQQQHLYINKQRILFSLL